MDGDDERVQDLVAELDALISDQDARVRIDLYGGGGDESYLRANRRGLQRLGIELLKAADAPFVHAEGEFAQHTVETKVKELFHEDTSVRLDFVERTDELDTETHLATEVERQRRIGWLWTLVLLILALVVLLLVEAAKGLS